MTTLGCSLRGAHRYQPPLGGWCLKAGEIRGRRG